MIGRKKMSGFPSLLKVEEALKLLRDNLKPQPLEVEEVSYTEALGRVVAQDLKAPFDVPPFNRSAVEGFAVVSEDTRSAAPTNPVELKIVGRAEAGDPSDGLPEVTRGAALEIFTGAPMPPGADSVVMVEHTKRVGEFVMVQRPVAPLHNVSRRGEDFTQGETVVKRGTRLKPWHVGALASLNIVKIPVYRRLRFAVVSTGRELKEPGGCLNPGEIVNSSKPMLKALIAEAGCVPLDFGTIPDEEGVIVNTLKKAISEADAAITTGGTSLGEKDLVPEAVNALGSPGVLAHGIAMRPAKPTGFGVVSGKPIFMLSGYPVAALVGFEVFVKPTIRILYQTFEEETLRITGRLTRKVATPVGVRSFVRVKLYRQDGEVLVEPLRLTGSGILSTMIRANGLLVVPENVEGFDEGENVEVIVLQPLEEAV